MVHDGVNPYDTTFMPVVESPLDMAENELLPMDFEQLSVQSNL